MSDERSLLEVIDEHLNATDFKLPPYSPVAARIQALAQRPDIGTSQLEQAILHDPALAGQILRVANSVMYAGLSKVSSIAQAISRLGTNEIVNLVVLC